MTYHGSAAKICTNRIHAYLQLFFCHILKSDKFISNCLGSLDTQGCAVAPNNCGRIGNEKGKSANYWSQRGWRSPWGSVRSIPTGQEYRHSRTDHDLKIYQT